MRITGGRLAGRVLPAPRGSAVRPTTDRVRESLFARLGDLGGLRVLDLYAGSGALGIEALSRGAREAVFVERSGPVAARLRDARARLGLADVARVVRGDVPAVLRRLGRADERFDLVLLDPPYGASEAPRALAALAASGVLAPDALVVLEASRRHPPGDVAGLAPQDERVIGDTLLVRYRREPTGATGVAEDA